MKPTNWNNRHNNLHVRFTFWFIDNIPVFVHTLVSFIHLHIFGRSFAQVCNVISNSVRIIKTTYQVYSSYKLSVRDNTLILCWPWSTEADKTHLDDDLAFRNKVCGIIKACFRCSIVSYIAYVLESKIISIFFVFTAVFVNDDDDELVHTSVNYLIMLIVGLRIFVCNQDLYWFCKSEGIYCLSI